MVADWLVTLGVLGALGFVVFTKLGQKHPEMVAWMKRKKTEMSEKKEIMRDKIPLKQEMWEEVRTPF